MTPNQEKAFDTVVNDFEGEVYNNDFRNAVFLAGYALGAQERQAQDAAELDRLTAEVAGLKADAQAKQAHIDRLMLEYCPSEMTTEQIFEWGRNQVPAAQEPTAQEQKT